MSDNEDYRIFCSEDGVFAVKSGDIRPVHIKPLIVDGIVQMFTIDPVNDELDALYPKSYENLWCKTYDFMQTLEEKFLGKAADKYRAYIDTITEKEEIDQEVWDALPPEAQQRVHYLQAEFGVSLNDIILGTFKDLQAKAQAMGDKPEPGHHFGEIGYAMFKELMEKEKQEHGGK